MNTGITSTHILNGTQAAIDILNKARANQFGKSSAIWTLLAHAGNHVDKIQASALRTQ